MIVVYDKKSGEIKYTIDHALDPSFIELSANEGVLISKIEYKGKARHMIVDLSGKPELINKT